MLGNDELNSRLPTDRPRPCVPHQGIKGWLAYIEAVEKFAMRVPPVGAHDFHDSQPRGYDFKTPRHCGAGRCFCICGSKGISTSGLSDGVLLVRAVVPVMAASEVMNRPGFQGGQLV